MGSNLKRQQIKQIPWIILFGFQHCESFKFLVVKINWNFLQCFRVEHPSPSEQQFYRMHCFVLIRIRFDDQSDQNQIRSEWSKPFLMSQYLWCHCSIQCSSIQHYPLRHQPDKKKQFLFKLFHFATVLCFFVTFACWYKLSMSHLRFKSNQNNLK